MNMQVETEFGMEKGNVINFIPAPKGNINAPLKVLLIDAWYDSYLGVMVLVRIHDGVLKKGMKVTLMRSKKEYQIEQVGILDPKPKIVDSLSVGEVGFITAAILELGVFLSSIKIYTFFCKDYSTFSTLYKLYFIIF